MPDPHFSNTPAYFKEIASGDTPSSGQVALYAKSDGKMYYKDDAGVETEVGGGGVAGYIVKTANYTAVAGDNILADVGTYPSGGSFTITLPASPVAGDIVIIVPTPASAIGYYVVTVSRNGNNINNTPTNVDIKTRGIYTFIYTTGTGWASTYTPAQGTDSSRTFVINQYNGSSTDYIESGGSTIMRIMADQRIDFGAGGVVKAALATGYAGAPITFTLNGYYIASQQTTPAPSINSAGMYSKDVGGTAEMFVMDEAGNETQISPHNHNAPLSLIDNSYDEVGYSANYYTGIITWTNRTRETSGKPNSRQFETFDEYNIRLNESMVQWDWDTVQSDHVAKSKEQHDIWLQRKSEWESNENNIDKPFEEKEPDIVTAKPQPQWLVDQLANRENFLAQRNAIPPVEMWQVKVWLARKNISLSTVTEILSTKIPEGPEREEALIRWEYVTVVPYDNILVGLIASELKIEKETAWREISSI